MTKRPQLLAALFVLLFTAILTKQASALDDPGVGRFCSRDPMRFHDSYNMFEYVSAAALNDLDPSGFFSVEGDNGFVYTEAELRRCRRILDSYTPSGGLAGNYYPCSGQLLQLFLSGMPPNSITCPEPCKRALARTSLPRDTWIVPKIALTTCSNSANGTPSCAEVSMSFNGNVEYRSGDLYYAIHGASLGWSAKGSCDNCCGKINRGLFGTGCCCKCNVTCNFDVTVGDEYNFCGTSFGDKFHITRCGCALEKWGKIKAGTEYTEFTVKCNYKRKKHYTHKQCGHPMPFDRLDPDDIYELRK